MSTLGPSIGYGARQRIKKSEGKEYYWFKWLGEPDFKHTRILSKEAAKLAKTKL